MTVPVSAEEEVVVAEEEGLTVEEGEGLTGEVGVEDVVVVLAVATEVAVAVLVSVVVGVEHPPSRANELRSKKSVAFDTEISHTPL